MPDAMLFAAAAAGQLSTAAGIETQAQRMLADAKAQNMVADFVEDWLDVNTIVLRPKDPAIYSMWSPDLVTAMGTEVRSFATSTILGTGSVSELLHQHEILRQSGAGKHLRRHRRDRNGAPGGDVRRQPSAAASSRSPASWPSPGRATALRRCFAATRC